MTFLLNSSHAASKSEFSDAAGSPMFPRTKAIQIVSVITLPFTKVSVFFELPHATIKNLLALFGLKEKLT